MIRKSPLNTVCLFSNETKDDGITREIIDSAIPTRAQLISLRLAFFHIKLYQIWCTSLASTYIQMEQGISLKMHYFLWPILTVDTL